MRRLLLVVVLLVAASACRGAASAPTSTSSPASTAMDGFVGVWTSQSSGASNPAPEPCAELTLTVASDAPASSRLTLNGSCGPTSFTALGSGSVADGVLRWQTDYIGTLTVLPRPSGGVCTAFRVNGVSLRVTSVATGTLSYSVVRCEGAREGAATVTRSP